MGIAILALAIGAAALVFARGSMAVPAPMNVAATDTRPVSRTINLENTDALRFTPDQLRVNAGETVAFQSPSPAAGPRSRPVRPYLLPARTL